MVLAQARRPVGKAFADAGQHGQARVQLDAVALAVVERHGFHMRIALQRQARQVVESCPPENSTSARR